MKTQIYFKKIQQLFSLILLLFLISTNFSAQTNNCQGYTLTQGGWGAPNLDNPHVSYLYGSFAGAFPEGLSLGCETGYKLQLTSPAAVTDFLPSGGTPSALDSNYTNPGSTYSNTLAGQLISVMLAVGFDNYDTNFSSPTIPLGEYIFTSGAFEGMTVNQFLVLANNFMGGCGVSAYSATQFNQAATAINENYDEGNRDLGYLKCCALQIVVKYDPINCFGETTIVHVTATGGSSATVGTGDFPKGAGTYTFTVTDGNCSSSETITIGQPDQLEAKISKQTPIDCYGGKSDVTVTPSGGTLPYKYLWNDVDNSETASVSLGAGSYSVVITDKNGCSITMNVIITQPDQLTAEISKDPIKCYGGTSEVTVTASGGTPEYNYLWNDAANSTTASVNLGIGSYSVVITDANLCTVTKTVEITEQPTKLEVEISRDPIKCYGEKSTVTVTPSGGTPEYYYLWNDAAKSTTASVSLGAGTYSVVITDDNGCSITEDVIITQPDLLSAKLHSTEILCNGGNSTASVTITGGTAPYTYAWSNDGTGETSVYVAGSYSVTITDDNGCTATANGTIIQPDLLTLKLSTPALVCGNGTTNVSVTVQGGTPEYKYLWSDGSTGSSAMLPSGKFTVTVTDKNGCIATASGEVKTFDCGKFTTVTQGGWGAKAAGKNWGTFRNQYFAGAFPSGLTVGAGSSFLKLTTAKAVEDFLPSGSTPRALNPGTLVDPGGTYSNVLAGQVVALTLNVRFDEYVASFSPSSTLLGDMIVVSGTFKDWTVYQVLAEANKVLGGLPSMYSPSEMNSIVDAINNNYDGGKIDNGLLTCPCPGAAKTITAVAAIANPIVPEVASQVTLYPNPSNGEFNLKFDADRDSPVLVQVYDLTGKLIGDYSSKVTRNGNKASLNVSNGNLVGGLYLVKVKTSTTEKTIKLIIKK
ncbi:T9SS type A sorting domain-containing protein [Kaistella polysaccharea]|uniref:T9SS type A sorting domain-containing protein n=1 Tax=Kaistella polysaccharea TaxID=2878534 RepID=UPI001CF11204|nr:T9SS type A sorting domain-containing protein [Kaistella polysaccharea]